MHERVIPIPDIKFQKRFTKKNHFIKKNGGDAPYADQRPSPGLGSDEEVFDKEVAQYAYNSPESKASLNPLFMNTRSFNISTTDYKQLKTKQNYDETMELDAKESKISV